jgi:hypothetical protein
MSIKQSGIPFEDMLSYAQQSQEVGQRYKVPGDQHLMHLLSAVAREAEASFGKKGLKMVEHAVTVFGEERGRRIAEMVKQDGKPLTLMNFFLYGDLDTSGNEMVPEFVDGELHVRVMKCRLFDKLHELGLEKYGKHYCRPIDKAVLRGYNPRLELEVKSQISGGADCCSFVYRQPPDAI